MKEALFFVWICFLTLLLMALCGCTNITKESTDIALNEINAIQQKIETLEYNLTPECKELFYDDLNHISVDLKNTKKTISQINESCNQEKSLLKSQNRTKNMWIVILLACVCGLWYYILKRK